MYINAASRGALVPVCVLHAPEQDYVWGYQYPPVPARAEPEGSLRLGDLQKLPGEGAL